MIRDRGWDRGTGPLSLSRKSNEGQGTRPPVPLSWLEVNMKSLVLAEKPSVAREIARVLNCNTKNKGFIEGQKYVVTWRWGTWLL